MGPSLRFERGARIDRYELLYEVGRGGMGAVWAALLRGKHGFQKLVAIKTILPEYASQPRFREMLLNEARITAGIEHPNVVQTLELGEQDGVLFIVMEWVEGESLFQLKETMSKRGIAMPLGITLRVIADVCAGLHAAHDMRNEGGHRVTVIHSDVSPHNILVNYRGIAKLADFGIAKVLERAVPTKDAASLRGKMRYIAPERVAGEAEDQRADIWSLGAVLEELLPETVPMTCSQLVKRALAPAREHRFATAQEFGAAVESAMTDCSVTTSSADVGAFFAEIFRERASAHRAKLDNALTHIDTLHVNAATPDSRRVRSRSSFRALATACALTALAAGAVLAARGVVAWPRSAPRSDESPHANTSVRRSVAVLGFANLSGDPETAWLSTALSQVLVGQLADNETLRVIAGESIGRMKSELGLDTRVTLSAESLARVRAYLDCDLLLLGSYSTTGERDATLRVDVRAESAKSGDVVLSMSERGRKEDALELFARIGRQVETRLGRERRDRTAPAAQHASLPRDPEAARWYAEGLTALWQLDALGARDRLERAVAREPNHALSHAALAEAFRQLGYGTRAAEAAKRANDMAADLPREERLLVEGRYREASLDWGKAIEIHRTLFEFFPDNIDYGLRLARAQQRAGKPDEVFGTLARLRELPLPPSAEIGIAEVEAETARAISDYRRTEIAAERAASLCAARGAWHCAAENTRVEADALTAQGKVEDSKPLRRQAKEFYERAGDRLSRAAAAFLSAREAVQLQDWNTALQLFGDAERDFHDLGNKKSETLAIDVQSRLLMRSGELGRALPFTRAHLSIGRETGDRFVQQSASINLGEVLISMGDLEAARVPLREALDLSRALSNRMQEAQSLDSQSTLLRHAGHIAEALRLRKEALERLRGVANAEPVNGWIEIRLAELLLDDGDAPRAERTAAEVLARSKPNTMVTIGGWLVRASARLALGDAAGAKQAIDRANGSNPTWLDMELDLQRSITAQRVRAVGPPDSAEYALRDLNAISARARELGIFTMQLEAQLAMGEIEIHSGRAASGRTRLRDLEKEARSKGYHRCARHAARLAPSVTPR